MRSRVVKHNRSLLYLAAGAVISFLIISSLSSLELQRTACYGICPVYTLRVWGNGLVQYHGEFGLIKGDQLSYIGPFEAWRLMWAALSYGMTRFSDTYSNGNEDNDGSRTCLNFGPFRRCVQIVYSPAALAPPARLLALNDLIDQLTHSVQWTGTIQQILEQYSRGHATAGP